MNQREGDSLYWAGWDAHMHGQDSCPIGYKPGMCGLDCKWCEGWNDRENCPPQLDRTNGTELGIAMRNQDQRENDLFPIATPRWMAARARARKRARLEHMARLERVLTPMQEYVEGEVEGWTTDYFQSRAEQGGLFQ